MMISTFERGDETNKEFVVIVFINKLDYRPDYLPFDLILYSSEILLSRSV